MTEISPRRIAVIDIGKTNAKVVLIDAATRQQLAARSTPNLVRRDGPYPHADVEMLWAFIRDSLGALHAAHGIEGISITTHGATGALLDENGLVMPVLDYEFEGPESSAEAYRRVRPAFAETLSPPLPNGLNLGAQLFWQQARFPALFARATTILPYAQYWAWRLTGIAASELTSLGCHTDLWAPARGDFSSLVERQGWRKLFPPLHPAMSVLGPVLPAVAAETGLPSSIPVTCGIHDSNASLLPHLGRQQPPFTIVSTGTWTILMSVGGDTGGLDPTRDSLANVDAFGRPVPTARFMGGREFDLLVPEIVEPGAAEIDSVLDHAIQVLPSFVPGVGPYGERKGSWTVDPATLSPGQRYVAASLYLALMARACLDLCGLGRTITVEGPLARNLLFGAALARLAGVSVHASGDSTGTSLGASLLFGGVLPETSGSHALKPLQHPAFDAYVAAWRRRVDD
ncbi:MAG: carbohydrate kinase [Pelagibacterium sp. SCN 63-23]|nr:MAG: carbohydrate kinase [Pelagibacterium sp. SCN 63-23]